MRACSDVHLRNTKHRLEEKSYSDREGTIVSWLLCIWTGYLGQVAAVIEVVLDGQGHVMSTVRATLFSTLTKRNKV